MTIESAKKFYQRIIEDDSLRSIFKETRSTEERQQLKQDYGYDFTREEWQEAVREIDAANEELSENELETVSGGINHEALVTAGLAAAYGTPSLYWFDGGLFE